MIEKVVTAAEDRETTWNKCVYHIGEVYEMYTTDKNDMQKALKLAKKYPNDVKIVKDDKYGMTFQFSMSGGSLFWRPKIRRTMTEEQKAQAREQLKTMRENKQA